MLAIVSLAAIFAAPPTGAGRLPCLKEQFWPLTKDSAIHASCGPLWGIPCNRIGARMPRHAGARFCRRGQSGGVAFIFDKQCNYLGRRRHTLALLGRFTSPLFRSRQRGQSVFDTAGDRLQVYRQIKRLGWLCTISCRKQCRRRFAREPVLAAARLACGTH